MPRTYRLVFCALAVLGLAADQSSKYAIFGWLRERPGYEQSVIPGVFYLVAQHVNDGSGTTVPYVNRGALFGWMQGRGIQAAEAVERGAVTGIADAIIAHESVMV